MGSDHGVGLLCGAHSRSQSGLRELALFAGAGGGILGGHLLGWRTVCAVEREPYAAAVLCARQNDGLLPPFPVWDDVCTFDGRPWRGSVDVVSGGFPCQDISAAGRGAGITGARSGMWSHMARIVGEVGPRFVFVENSPVLTSRGLGTVLGDLTSLGYDAEWTVLGAADVGAPHQRDRIWILAHTDCPGLAEREGQRGDHGQKLQTAERGGLSEGEVSDSDEARSQVRMVNEKHPVKVCRVQQGSNWWETEPDVGRVADGVAHRVDRLSAIGNGQVPAVAALAWRVLSDRILTRP